MPERAEVSVTTKDIVDTFNDDWKLIGYRVYDEKFNVNHTLLRTAIGKRGENAWWFTCGKLIIATIPSVKPVNLCFHLGMTGSLKIKDHAWFDKTEHPRFTLFFRNDHTEDLDNNVKQLVFCDVRKFGKVFVQPAIDKFPHQDSFDIGENMPFKEEIFEELLAQVAVKNKKPIKSFLLEQNHFIGYGNYTVCEVLHRAFINPLIKTCDLSSAQISLIRIETYKLIQEMIDLGGVSFKNYVRPIGIPGQGVTNLKVYGRKNQPCLTCNQDTIQYIKIAQRGTFFCPTCQPIIPHYGI